jgi:hypothetical protein
MVFVEDGHIYSNIKIFKKAYANVGNPETIAGEE